MQEKDVIEKELTLIERRRAAISKLPKFRGEAPSKNTIRHLRDVSPGEIFWITGENKAYIVADREGKRISLKPLDENTAISLGLTLFELNQIAISKEPLFDFNDEVAVQDLTRKLEKFFTEDCSDTFFLLYGRDLNYLSIIRDENGFNQDIDAILESIKNVGDLISMDFEIEGPLDSKVEIWVRTNKSKAELLYLFPYDDGIIEI